MSPLTTYLFRNLGTRPFISALVLGCMLIVGMTNTAVIATGVGLLSAFGANGHDSWVVVTSAEARNENDSRLSIESIGAITVGPEIKRFSPEVVTTNMVAHDFDVHIVMLRALDPIGFEMRPFRLLEGRMPEPGKNEIMVGESMLGKLPSLHVGGTVTLLNTVFTSVGVFRSPGFQTGEVWTTRETMLMDPARRHLSVIYLETGSAAEARAVVDRLRASRALKVTATVEPAFYKHMSSEYDNVVLGLVIVFALVVTGSMLSATSLLAVLQQQRLAELCVLRAIGFRDRVIAMLILAETELLVVTGGCVGIVAAMLAMKNFVIYAVAWSLSTVTLKAAPTWGQAGIAAAIMVFIGVGGAIVPIVRMRVTAITRGLREE